MPKPAAALLALLSQAGIAWGAEQPVPPEVLPQVVVERVEGGSPEENTAYEETFARYQSRMEEFRQDIKSYVRLREDQTKQQVSRSYGRSVNGLSDEEESLRTLTKTRFEGFLEKYPEADYTPHVMFRLAELYFEEAENVWLKEMDDYNRLEAASQDSFDTLPPPPLKDYRKPLDMYERISGQYPSYERADGVLYMLGYCYWEPNSGQRDESKGKDAFLKLVASTSSTQFGNDANFRLGEYFFENNETERSIPYYEKIVARGEEGRYYDKALYKLAWSHYKLANTEHFEEYTKALDLFKQLLDYSQHMLMATGEVSPMQKEAVQYMAISFADMGDIKREPPHIVAERYFKEVGDRAYEPDMMKWLAKVLTDQARYEEAIEAYRYLQRRWPLDPENPKFQYKVAQLYMNLPVKDPESSARAQMELARLYNDETDWWQQNKNINPDALAVAKGYIEQSLAQVAIDYHIKAQTSERPDDYSVAADKYRDYLRKFPFADDYYEMEWYLADALLKANRLEEAEREYVQLLKTSRHEYQDGALYRLMQTRRQRLVNIHGRVEARPENAILEKEITSSTGGVIKVYMLDDEHKAFIEIADRLMVADIKDPQFLEPRNRDLPALQYLTGQILYEFGHLPEARERLFKVVEKYPRRDEGAYAAALVVRSYQDEKDLENVRKYTHIYSTVVLGESKEAVVKVEEFKDLEEGAAFTLAYNLIAEGKREEAARAFLTFLGEYPKSVHVKDALFNAANNLEIIGKADEANKLFEDYINKYPKDERSKGLYFRIASNYGSILELDKAIMYYKRLVQNFPDAPDSPGALFNAAFLQIGIGSHKGAAEDFETYATRYSNQGDAEIAYYSAGEQWEAIGDEEALAFYRRYLKRYPGIHADHSMEAQYRVIKILEKQGRPTEKEWKSLAELYASFATKVPVGQMGRRYAAEAEFRGVWTAFEDFRTFKFSGNEEKDAILLLDTKVKKLDELSNACLQLIQRYQDFVYSSAALYVQASAYFAYADMLFNAPAPKGFSDEAIEIFRSKLDEFRLPVEDKGKARAQFNVQKAREEKSWSEWQTRTLVLLNERFPTEYPREKKEERYSEKAWVTPSVGPMTIELPEEVPAGGQGGAR